ncbi:hypothetical protein [Nonomuraea sp. B19D2]|uniref:hypothetical protein n=1 Tax=Nonomuraea sp. B19D2 TaxID=3159561 RepID=UPI0032DB1BB2
MAAGGDTTEELSDEPARRNRLLFRNRDYTGWWLGETVSNTASHAISTASPPWWRIKPEGGHEERRKIPRSRVDSGGSRSTRW